MKGLFKLKESQHFGIIFLFLIFCSLGTFAQEKVKWMSWDEALEKSKIEKRKVFVDVYTNWCGWCKKMDKATFQNPAIAKFLNDNFYAVKFNAEQREDINFRDKTHKFVRSGRRGYHELAIYLTQGRLSYPTIVFLDENFNILQPIPGFRGPEEFEVMMTYFSGDYFKSTPWKNYVNAYVPIQKKSNKLSVPVNFRKNP